MSILTVVQDAAVPLGIERPAAVYASTADEVIELRRVAEDMATRIASERSWQALQTLATFAGDGVTAAFDLPTDWGWIDKDAQMWSSSLETPLLYFDSLNRWLEIDVQEFEYVINAWTIYGDQVHFKPALGSGETARIFYTTDRLVTASDGTRRRTFEEDTDAFRLSERLLMLGVIWQWKAYKGYPYAEDQATYQQELDRLAARDRGTQMQRIGRCRGPRGFDIAWVDSVET